MRRVWVYLALAFAISWGAYALRRFGSFDPTADEALRLTVKFGPSLAGIGVAAAYGGKSGLLDLFRRLLPPTRSATWAAIALGLPIMIVLVALPLRAVIGGSIRPLALPPLGQGLSAFLALLATR